MNTETDLTESKPEMPQSGIPWRTFSIFISSTFADMQAERDHLKNVVFPKVEEELQQRRIKLEIVDLRWGVDTTSMEQEDEREASVLKVCLDEIRRCRPFFIGLLGDRYGWVPPLERMQTALVGETHINPEKGKSVTDLEIEFGVLASKEQLVRSVFYFREPLNYATFSKKKAAMFSDEHNDELSEAEKKERKNALEKLKTNIINHFANKKLENKVKTYKGTWDAENEKLTGLESWGDQVYIDILKECKSHAKKTWDKVPQNWQEQELALLDAFIEQHTHITTTIKDGKPEPVPTFCGREELLKELRKHLLSDDSNNWGKVLTGESGSGKSAVFSMVNKLMKQEDCFVLAHSAGISPRAKKVADLLKIWNNLLRKHLGIDQVMEDTSPSHPSPFGEGPGVRPETPIEELQKLFTELLQMASANKRVVLLIDALDRFETTARAQHLSWLPSLMPQNVKLLCTAITGTEQKAVQYHKGLTTKSIDSFTSVEAKEMLDALCLRQHKSLPPKIEKIILEKKRSDGQPATSSPLWLSLAVNMLMAIDHDDFEKMSHLEGRGDQQIESYLINLANGFDHLPGPLFLSLKNKAGVLFGETFTAAIFNFIAISRNGLREKDLEKLLPAYNINWDPLRFSNLRRWFKAHLVLQGEELQWNLAHNILKSALIQNTDETQLVILHESIAKYLLHLNNDPLKATETIYHLINANNHKAAAIYFSSALTTDEASGATSILSEIATTDEKGLKLVCNLPRFVLSEFKSFHGILKRFIYELNTSLEEEGNLAERLALLKKLEENLVKTYGNSVTDENFGYDTATIYEKLGSIHYSMGQLEDALKYFKIFNQLFKILYEANPRIVSLKNGLAISYQRLGSIHQSMSHMEEALMYFDEVFRLFKELHETNPQIESLKSGHAKSYLNLGVIHQAMGHMEEALKYFENYNQITNELNDANPRSEPHKNDLAFSYENLGFIHQSMGHTEEALKHFDEGFRLFKELYEANPRSVSLKGELAISYENLGFIHQSMGHTKETLQYFDDEVRLFKELYEANPHMESLKSGLAISFSKLGKIHQSMGHMEEALNYFENFNQFSKELNESNPRSEELKYDLAISYENLGSIHQSMGHTEEALKYFEEVFRLSKELYEANPHKESLKSGFAISFAKLGKINQSLGHTEEAFKYFENYNQFSKELYEANPQSESLKNDLAISYEKLGEIHQSMGHMEEALKCFDEVYRLFKELHEANPRSESLKNSLAISHEKLGDIHQAMSRMEEALNYFENFNQFSKELYEANPRSEEMKKSLVISFSKLGSIHQAMGQMEEALNYFENYNQFSKELCEANPRSEELKNDLAISYENLGSIHQAMGHTEEALNYFENFNQFSKELYEANPRSVELKNDLAISFSKLGSIHQTMGHMEEALNYFENYNRLSKELYEANLRNEELKNDLAISYKILGFIHQSMGHTEEALKYFENDLALTKELYEANPRSEDMKKDLARSYGQLGEIHQSIGHMGEALKYFENYNQLIKELCEANPYREENKNSLASSYGKLGEIHQSMGHMGEALKYFENYNQLCKELYESNPRNIGLFEGLGISYYKLAMLYKAVGNNSLGKERFAEWKKIISFLAENVPQVNNYREWNKIEY